MRLAAAGLVLATVLGVGAVERGPRAPDPADSFVPEYTPPAPGSYRLPVVDTIDDHPLLDAEGRRTSLFALKRDRLAVVAFIYTSCAEAGGCPVSTAVLHRLDRLLAADPVLAGAATLVTVSFDPERDTPPRMARVRDLHQPQADWRFATAADQAELEPLLADLGQPVVKLRYPDGRWSGLFRHVLKVFLLDHEHRVRNVYSVGLLNPALVLNDLKTLLMEAEARIRR